MSKRVIQISKSGYMVIEGEAGATPHTSEQKALMFVDDKVNTRDGTIKQLQEIEVRVIELMQSHRKNTYPDCETSCDFITAWEDVLKLFEQIK